MASQESLDSQPDPLASSLGSCITQQREAANLSIAALASRAGMARAYLWRVERGLTLPNLRNIARIALALKMPVHVLIEGLDIADVDLTNRNYRKK